MQRRPPFFAVPLRYGGLFASLRSPRPPTAPSRPPAAPRARRHGLRPSSSSNGTHAPLSRSAGAPAKTSAASRRHTHATMSPVPGRPHTAARRRRAPPRYPSSLPADPTLVNHGRPRVRHQRCYQYDGLGRAQAQARGVAAAAAQVGAQLARAQGPLRAQGRVGDEEARARGVLRGLHAGAAAHGEPEPVRALPDRTRRRVVLTRRPQSLLSLRCGGGPAPTTQSTRLLHC